MFSKKVHRYIFLFGACSLAFGMMTGAVPTSVPQFILMGNWLLEMDFKRKVAELKTNKVFWALAAFFLIHVAGLIYTSNIDAGLGDLRIKVPLLLLPLVFFTTRPLTKSEFHILLYCFLLGSVVNVTWCYIYSFILHKNEIARSASRFMSHIRLGLYLNMAISTCVYFIYNNREASKRILFSLLIIFFLFGMYALGLASGIVNFILLACIYGIYLIFKLSLTSRIVIVALLLAGIFSVFFYIKSVYNSQLLVNKTPYNTIQDKNSNGRLYSHIETTGGQKENGNYVFINIQFDELKNEWNRRCPEDSFSYTPQHNLKRYEVLLRYLTSKSLSKDSSGIWQLSNEDIANIKGNINNAETNKWSYLHKRVYEIVYEYDEFKHGRHINGHSLTMRPYFWSAALLCIKHNPVFGVGTGDVQEEMNRMYIKSNSPLAREWYKRPHNQFLTITVALGCVGLVIFFMSLVWPIRYLRGNFEFLFSPFVILTFSSFILEDTLESQAGVTFYAFFSTLFLSKAWHKKNHTGCPENPSLKKPRTPVG